MSTAIPPDPDARHDEAERALVASDRRLADQSAALTQLMARYADSPGSLDEQIRGILATTAHTLGADRVSLWQIERQRDRIVCWDLYERALDHFEAQEFRKAAHVLGEYLPEFAEDGPSQILLWRAVNWLVKPKRKFRKAWELPGK